MICDVSRCQSDAVVMVKFIHHGAPVAYCRYHAFYSSGRPRWKQELIVSMKKVGSR